MNCRKQLVEGIRLRTAGPNFGKPTDVAQGIATMPKTYATDGQGSQAIAHLHYFTGGCDRYVTEKDC